MTKITIDGLEINDQMVHELTKWFENPSDSAPQNYVEYIDYIKDTLIRLLTDDSNSELLYDMKESLAFLLMMQDSLKRLIPEQS